MLNTFLGGFSKIVPFLRL